MRRIMRINRARKIWIKEWERGMWDKKSCFKNMSRHHLKNVKIFKHHHSVFFTTKFFFLNLAHKFGQTMIR